MNYELHWSIGFKINQTANKLNSKFSQILQQYDIAPEQRATLEIIKYEKDVNQTKISKILGKDKTTVSRALRTLERKELIIKDRIDRRTNLIKLSPKGEDILEKTKNEVKDFRQSIVQNISDEEFKLLNSLLEKVVSNIECKK
ncbi:MarR family winged helix-turn-helix transcriptional regulator [Arcobacter sp. YIC-464]|uniref:MarR family winged helix-turn-helix transcriptional regulator n=1 Tax=Arcobacter sp. YIC-464 TaxID=3376631 RepID=UPI003C1DF4FA